VSLAHHPKPKAAASARDCVATCARGDSAVATGPLAQISGFVYTAVVTCDARGFSGKPARAGAPQLSCWRHRFHPAR